MSGTRHSNPESGWLIPWFYSGWIFPIVELLRRNWKANPETRLKGITGRCLQESHSAFIYLHATGAPFLTHQTWISGARRSYRQ